MNVNFIDQEIFRCRQFTGSYPIFPNLPFKTEDLIKTIYHIVKGRSSNMELKTTQYAESTGTKNVVYIGVCLPIKYKGNVYSVYSKIVFPPNFPLVPPIFSILNINENQFEVNKKYFSFLLPDKTYEVKLMSSKYWKQGFDFNALLNEFCNNLGLNFPFFKTNNPRKNFNMPVIYDPRYNLINMEFPFDYNINDSYHNSSNDQGYVQPNNNPSNDSFSNNNDYNRYNNQYMNRGSNQYNNSNNNRENNHYPAVKETLENMKNIIEIDLVTYEKNLATLIEKKEQLEMKEHFARDCETKLQKNIITLNKDIERISEQYEEQKDKELNDKTVQSMILLDSNKKKILKTHATIKGSIDAQQAVEDLYLEKELGEFKDVLKNLNMLWKREFDARLGFNAYTNNVE